MGNLDRRLMALEGTTPRSLSCRACAHDRGAMYCRHTLPQPFRSLVPAVELGADEAKQWRKTVDAVGEQ